MLSRLLNRNKFGAPENKGTVISEPEAMQLLNDWVKNERLLLHMKQVGHLMSCWAKDKEGLDEAGQWKWKLAGLLHDADWDQWPDEHCAKIISYLEEKKIDAEIIHAIASHGPRYFGVEPENNMDKMLYAFDELSGFVHAYSLMRPKGYEGMEIKGVRKRLKDKIFAANVSREDIHDASARAEIPADELVQFVIERQGEFSRL